MQRELSSLSSQRHQWKRGCDCQKTRSGAPPSLAWARGFVLRVSQAFLSHGDRKGKSCYTTTRDLRDQAGVTVTSMDACGWRPCAVKPPSKTPRSTRPHRSRTAAREVLESTPGAIAAHAHETSPAEPPRLMSSAAVTFPPPAASGRAQHSGPSGAEGEASTPCQRHRGWGGELQTARAPRPRNPAAAPARRPRPDRRR